jgi:hypothetical protein
MNILPVITSLISLFRNRQVPGVSPDVVQSVLDELEAFSKKDTEAQNLMAEQLNSARTHEAQTFDATDKFSNTLRSSVRPVITMAAMGWYIWARANGVPLEGEDYAIIGGVLAFWFGFRPFEKRGVDK